MNAELEAEVERLREDVKQSELAYNALAEAALKHEAEVERLRRSVDRRDATIERLRKENERLGRQLDETAAVLRGELDR